MFPLCLPVGCLVFSCLICFLKFETSCEGEYVGVALVISTYQLPGAGVEVENVEGRQDKRSHVRLRESQVGPAREHQQTRHRRTTTTTTTRKEGGGRAAPHRVSMRSFEQTMC